MRISDWSSDVCSSDLGTWHRARGTRCRPAGRTAAGFSGARASPLANGVSAVTMNAMTESFDVARQTFLEPAELDENRIADVLGRLMKPGVDSADLYFQHAVTETWSLDDSKIGRAQCREKGGQYG